jgi:head-tail adaptor
MRSDGEIGDMGTPASDWVKIHKKVPANIYHTGGTEAEQGGQTIGIQSLVCEIRFRKGLHSSMRLVDGDGVAYGILSVKDLTGHRRQLTLELKAISSGSRAV